MHTNCICKRHHRQAYDCGRPGQGLFAADRNRLALIAATTVLLAGSGVSDWRRSLHQECPEQFLLRMALLALLAADLALKLGNLMSQIDDVALELADQIDQLRTLA